MQSPGLEGHGPKQLCGWNPERAVEQVKPRSLGQGKLWLHLQDPEKSCPNCPGRAVGQCNGGAEKGLLGLTADPCF